MTDQQLRDMARQLAGLPKGYRGDVTLGNRTFRITELLKPTAENLTDLIELCRQGKTAG